MTKLRHTQPTPPQMVTLELIWAWRGGYGAASATEVWSTNRPSNAQSSNGRSDAFWRMYSRFNDSYCRNEVFWLAEKIDRSWKERLGQHASRVLDILILYPIHRLKLCAICLPRKSSWRLEWSSGWKSCVTHTRGVDLNSTIHFSMNSE